MASLKSIFGLFPNTESYESLRDNLANEYKALIQFSNSEELKRYLELKKFIESDEFKSEKEELLNLKYKGSAEFKDEQELNKLRKNKHIVLYNKTVDSPDFQNYLETKDSADLKKFIKLEEDVKTDEFLEVKNFYKLSAKKRFAASDLGSTLRNYKEQAGRKDIKSYNKVINHKLFYSCNQFIESGKEDELNKLSEEVNSSTFRSKKAGMKKSEFMASEEGRKWEKYQSLIKSSEYKAYKKITSSHDYQAYKKLHGTPEMDGFLDMERFINSNEFQTQKKEIEVRSFDDTAEYKTLYEYERLKKETKIRSYHSFLKSKAYENYNEVHQSDMLKRFELLLEKISSPDFMERKAYLTMSGKKRWHTSDTYKQLTEFEKLDQSKDIVWYNKNKNAAKFDWFRTWELSFEEEFNGKQLDRKKWLPRYFWGEEVLKKSYSFDMEKHYISDGDNLTFTGNSIQIETRKETASGISLQPDLGFIPKEFNYTSGLISTAKSFSQLYGTFEAKIKFHSSKKVLNAFWMAAKKQLPHIDIAKALDSVEFGNKWKELQDKPLKKIKRSKTAGKYFIYTLEWEKDKLTWKINGQVVANTSNGIPEEPLYLVFSSGLYTDLNGTELPAAMEVEWVKAYKKIPAED